MKIETMAEYASRKALQKSAHKDRLPGGLADKRKPRDFDAGALKQGISVELEHTNDRTIATEIAMDHLAEDGDYYKKLARMEGKASQLFIGPRGGKWANPQHTVPYHEPTRRGRKDDKAREREALLRKTKRRGPGEGGEVQLNHQELRLILNTGKFALVSAGPNPEYDPHKGMSPTEAAERHQELKSKLVAAGFMHTKVTGHYGGREDSFLVMIHDADRGAVRQLGEIFKQDSVIYAEGGRNEMHYTYGPKAEKGLCVEGKSWSEKPAAQDFYSVVHHPNGTRTKFALNFKWGEEKPCRKSMVHTLQKARKLAGRMTFQGMNISIETAKGQTRKWYDPHHGRHGETTMLYDYGYIRGTLGTDGDHVDVYIGPNENASAVYIISQLKAPDFKTFDEQKCMLGFDDDTTARAAYLAHYDDPRFFGGMEVMEISKFRSKVLDQDNHGEAIEKSMKPPKGYTKAPGSKKGGYRKRVAGGWHYWYPGQPHPGAKSEPRTGSTARKPGPDPTQPPDRAGKPVKPAVEGTSVVFADSTTDKAERPGIWKMENGAFHLKRSRVYEAAADGKQIRKTELVPSVDETTKLQLIEEFTPLIRKAARDAQRQFALKSRFEMGMGGTTNDVQTELQRGGIEGLLNAVRTYRGRGPFAAHAKRYVGMYVTMEARQQRHATDLPQMHHKNLRKFIGAKVKAQVRFKTENPTPEQIAKYFELRLKHVHKGVEPGKRNELVPMEPYKLGIGRRGVAPEVHVRGKGKVQVKEMRDVVEQRSRVEWARMYDAYLQGNKASLSFDAQGQQIFAELFAGRGLDTEDQVAVRNQINFAMHKMKGLGEVIVSGPAPGRPRGGKQAMTEYSVVDIAEVLKRRLGVDGHEEHSISDLAAVIPIYRRKADGDWAEVSERSARAHMQTFIDEGMEKLRQAVQDRGHIVRGVVDRAAAVVAPKERLPEGPTYHEKMKALADAMTAGQIEEYRMQQVSKLQRSLVHQEGEHRERFERSIQQLQSMPGDELALRAARASVEGQRLSVEMRRAMTQFIDVERVGAHEGIAYMRDADGKPTAIRVRMGYDRSYDPTTPAGSPLLLKGFELLTDSILREIQKWPETMGLLVSDYEPAERRNLELMAL